MDHVVADGRSAPAAVAGWCRHTGQKLRRRSRPRTRMRPQGILHRSYAACGRLATADRPPVNRGGASSGPGERISGSRPPALLLARVTRKGGPGRCAVRRRRSPGIHRSEPGVHSRPRTPVSDPRCKAAAAFWRFLVVDRFARPPDRTAKGGRADMRREWSPEKVVACWTPVGDDWDLAANKSGRLGSASCRC